MKKIFLPITAAAVVLLWIGMGLGLPFGSDGASGPVVFPADNALTRAGRELAGVIREVTAYNVGVREQTSDFPCIGAMGVNLCDLVAQGRKICAANFVALGTILNIEGIGECVVLDRMNRRFAERVDLAMSEDEIEEARTFGVRKLAVAVK